MITQSEHLGDKGNIVSHILVFRRVFRWLLLKLHLDSILVLIETIQESREKFRRVLLPVFLILGIYLT